MSSQIAGLASQMQNQMNLNFQNMQQQMFQPMMAQMQRFHESLHSDIAALDSRFEDLPSSEQFEQRQEQLEQRFDAFSTAFTGFSDHFYSVFPAPVPPPEFYPHQPFYPPPPPPPAV